MQLSLEQETPYSRTVEGLLKLISRSRIGERLPSERDLSVQFSVSRPTVRKALEALTERQILEARQGAGTYIRRALPPQLRTRTSTKLIGLSVPTLEVPTIAQVALGAEQQVAQSGYRMVLVHDRGEPAAQERDIGMLLNGDVDGLLIFLDRDNVVRPEYVRLLKNIQEREKPVVLLDRYVPGLELPCVLTDTALGMYQATRHILKHGRQRLAILSWGDQAGIAERNRMAGFCDAMIERGLPVEPVLRARIGYGQAPEVAARRAVEAWIKQYGSHLPFDGIVCFLDNMAYGAFLALKDAGIRVPEDIALVGFDNVNSEPYRAMGLELTSVEQPFEKMGQVAAQRVIARSEGEAAPSQATEHVLLTPKLIVRSSCGEEQA